MTRHDAEVHKALCAVLNRMDAEGWCDTYAGNGGSGGGCVIEYAFAVPCTPGTFFRALEMLAAAMGVLDECDASRSYYAIPIGCWNDSHTEAEVRAVVAAAISFTAPPPPDPLNDMDPTSDSREGELVSR